MARRLHREVRLPRGQTPPSPLEEGDYETCSERPAKGGRRGGGGGGGGGRERGRGERGGGGRRGEGEREGAKRECKEAISYHGLKNSCSVCVTVCMHACVSVSVCISEGVCVCVHM